MSIGKTIEKILDLDLSNRELLYSFGAITVQEEQDGVCGHWSTDITVGELKEIAMMLQRADAAFHESFRRHVGRVKK